MGRRALCTGGPMSQGELDEACEVHLAERFGERLDFCDRELAAHAAGRWAHHAERPGAGPHMNTCKADTTRLVGDAVLFRPLGDLSCQ